jgi:hypothetical protein
MDEVADSEILYRRIPFGIQAAVYYSRQPDGTVRVSSSAFGDRTRRVSVDRALLCAFDPSHTQRTTEDGVVSLPVGEIRNNSVSTYTKGGEPSVIHLLDVEPAPLVENQAHAEIVANPAIVTDSTFKRLCQLLARLAQWKIYPADCR